jgi:hypothetical protein
MKYFNENKLKKHLSIALLLLVYVGVLGYLSSYLG